MGFYPNSGIQPSRWFFSPGGIHGTPDPQIPYLPLEDHVKGTLAATSPVDTAAFVGKVRVVGTLAATSPGDTAAFVGTVIVRITGTFAAASPQDTASFHGAVRIRGTLAATSPADTAAFVGKVLAAASPLAVLCGIADYPVVCLASISDEVAWSTGGFDYPEIEMGVIDE
jgi:hypothetical protein